MRGSETCEDGNHISNDGCDSNCQKESGWTFTDVVNSTGIFTTATPLCGDSRVVGNEICDDGAANDIFSVGCQADCQSFFPNYFCSGGDSNTPSTCTGFCGDGFLASNETCEDGNTANGDGCSSLCMVEPGWGTSAPGGGT